MKTYMVNGKVVGWIEGHTYVTKRDPLKHLMRIYDAWGISDSIILDLPKQGVTDIKVVTPKRLNYLISLHDFKLHAVIKVWWGDKQWFTPRKRWTTSMESSDKPTIKHEQGELFKCR